MAVTDCQERCYRDRRGLKRVLTPFLRLVVIAGAVAGVGAWASCPTRLAADVKPAGVFGDHMVLQRDRPIPIWGRARPGREVTVRIGRQSRTAKAAADGRWQVRLAPMPATSKPLTITITGENTVTIRDVLVGEVWVAAGS